MDCIHTSTTSLQDLRVAGLELIQQHTAAVGIIAEALADVDLAYQLATDARTQDDWQALRDAETRLRLLIGGGE